MHILSGELFMPASVINNKFNVSKDEWVVSIINTGSKSGGYAAIVVEGIETDEKYSLFQQAFINQYDITAQPDPEQSGSLNIKGYINQVRCYEGAENKRDYQGKKFPGESKYAEPLAVKRMIDSIKKDAVHTERAMENISRKARSEPLILDEKNIPIEPFRFQYLGKNHPLVKIFGNTTEGNNCASWSLEKLSIANIGDGDGIPKPKKVAGQIKCTIL